jgi:hypothetical protein
MKKNITKEIFDLDYKPSRFIFALLGRLINFLFTTIPFIFIYKKYNLVGYEIHIATVCFMITVFISYCVLGFWQFLTTKYWINHG